MPNTLIVIFPSRTSLIKALDFLTVQSYLDIVDAAIVAKAHNGEVTILNGDITANEGGIAGGTLGAAITALGLVHYGALALTGIGAIVALGTGLLLGGMIGRVTGRFATYLRDVGFKNSQIEDLAEQLQEGHPALVMELRGDIEDILPRLRQELRSYNAELVERLQETWQINPLQLTP